MAARASRPAPVPSCRRATRARASTTPRRASSPTSPRTPRSCRKRPGPVLTLQTFRDEDEAVRLANDTRFGLAATLATGDHERADRVTAQLVAGTVWVNCFFVRDLQAPFGGSRESGVGREGGTWSFDFYCDPQEHRQPAPKGWKDHG